MHFVNDQEPMATVCRRIAQAGAEPQACGSPGDSGISSPSGSPARRGAVSRPSRAEFISTSADSPARGQTFDKTPDQPALARAGLFR